MNRYKKVFNKQTQKEYRNQEVESQEGIVL